MCVLKKEKRKKKGNTLIVRVFLSVCVRDVHHMNFLTVVHLKFDCIAKC